MSLTSYLAAPSRDWTMRLSARGGMIGGDRLGLQGKFCLCSEVVLLFARDAYPPTDDLCFHLRVGRTCGPTPGPGGAAYRGGTEAAGWRGAASGGGLPVPILPVSVHAVGVLAAGVRGGFGVAGDGGFPGPASSVFGAMLCGDRWIFVRGPSAANGKGAGALGMDPRVVSSDAGSGSKLRLSRVA